MTLQDKISAASMTLNVVWFIYAMLNTRWTRKRVLEMRAELRNAIERM